MSTNDSTVAADSDFRHFSNSLAKHGFDYAAGYVAGLALGVGSHTLTALEVYQRSVDRRVFQEYIAYFDILTPGTKSLTALEDASFDLAQPGANGEIIAEIKNVIPDPWKLLAANETVTLKLTRSELAELVNQFTGAARPELRKKLQEAAE